MVWWKAVWLAHPAGEALLGMFAALLGVLDAVRLLQRGKQTKQSLTGWVR